MLRRTLRTCARWALDFALPPRCAGCDVVVDDDSVSAQHARLEYDMGGWRITDLQSTNGTAVEGVRLAPGVPTPLPYGVTVRLGGVQLQFREVEHAAVFGQIHGNGSAERPSHQYDLLRP